MGKSGQRIPFSVLQNINTGIKKHTFVQKHLISRKLIYSIHGLLFWEETVRFNLGQLSNLEYLKHYCYYLQWHKSTNWNFRLECTHINNGRFKRKVSELREKRPFVHLKHETIKHHSLPLSTWKCTLTYNNASKHLRDSYKLSPSEDIAEITKQLTVLLGHMTVSISSDLSKHMYPSWSSQSQKGITIQISP